MQGRQKVHKLALAFTSFERKKGEIEQGRGLIYSNN